MSRSRQNYLSPNKNPGRKSLHRQKNSPKQRPGQKERLSLHRLTFRFQLSLRLFRRIAAPPGYPSPNRRRLRFHSQPCAPAGRRRSGSLAGHLSKKLRRDPFPKKNLPGRLKNSQPLPQICRLCPILRQELSGTWLLPNANSPLRAGNQYLVRQSQSYQNSRLLLRQSKRRRAG